MKTCVITWLCILFICYQVCETSKKRPGVGECVSSCKRVKKDGDYQSCDGCDHFVSCSHQRIYSNRPCAPVHPGEEPLQWDDKVKRCVRSSTTCTPRNCMSNCVGKANGDYHSCSGCDVFASCLDDVLYDNRECAANLVWDDTLKRCEYTSPTCETP